MPAATAKPYVVARQFFYEHAGYSLRPVEGNPGAGTAQVCRTVSTRRDLGAGYELLVSVGVRRHRLVILQPQASSVAPMGLHHVRRARLSRRVVRWC